MPWLGIAATLGWNYVNHRAGRPTICSTARRFLPKPVLLSLYTGGAALLAVHVARGYVKILDLPDP